MNTTVTTSPLNPVAEKEMKCGICSGDAIFVDHGAEVGAYWYCRACKKEEKEWKTKAVIQEPKPEIEFPILEIPNFTVYYESKIDEICRLLSDALENNK